MKGPTPNVVSQSLTPIEIKNKEFKKGMLGYVPAEVVTFLDQVAKVWEQVQKHDKELTERLRRAEEELATWRARETELDVVREKATKEGEAIRSDASREAEKLLTEAMNRAEEIRQKTEEWLASVISVVEETEKQRDMLVVKLRTALDQHYALLENDKETTRPLLSHLSEFIRETVPTHRPNHPISRKFSAESTPLLS